MAELSDPSPRRSQGPHRSPQTEAAILDAAEALLAEEGFHGLTMEAVARRARAGKATLYRWWPSRAQLLLAVYSRSKERMEEPDTGSLQGDLTAYMTHMLTLWRDTAVGPMLRLVIGESQSDPALRAALQNERSERWHHIDNIIERAAARGELAQDLSIAEAEERIIAQAWYLLLTDRLPPDDAGIARLVAAAMLPMRA